MAVGFKNATSAGKVLSGVACCSPAMKASSSADFCFATGDWELERAATDSALPALPLAAGHRLDIVTLTKATKLLYQQVFSYS